LATPQRFACNDRLVQEGGMLPKRRAKIHTPADFYREKHEKAVSLGAHGKKQEGKITLGMEKLRHP